jgi:predicted dehydrogenase
MAKAKQLRIGLIGLGRMGQNHLRVLTGMDPVQIAFIYDADSEKTSQLARQYGVKRSENPEKDLSQVDAAIIVTPTTTHAHYIDLAARYTPHLFVEKPLTDSLESTRAVAEIARSRDLRIQVGFIERFNPAVVKLKQVALCAPGLVSMDFVRTDKVVERNTDVDVVLDLMIHDLDLAMFLAGPVMQAHGHGYAPDGITILAHATLVHENGTLTRILSSKMTEKRVRRINITCPELFVEADLLKRELEVHPQTAEQQYSRSVSSPGDASAAAQANPLLSQLLAFVGYCRGESCGIDSPIPTLEAALAAMELAENIRLSINQGLPASQNKGFQRPQ